MDGLRERFWSGVRFDEGCWEWQRSIQGAGYGQLYVDGRARTAHRLCYELTFGPIPDGLCVLHRCDNRRCVRPTHLFLGTKKDNTADAWAKGRAYRQPRGFRVSACKYGHPYTEANTYVHHGRRPDGEPKTNRLCRTCARERNRRNRAKVA